MNIAVLGKVIDERFLNHRLKSTSYAGIIGGLLAISLFAYRFYVTGIWSWDLFAVAFTFVMVKVSMMTWYRFTD
ncbi:MAG TPA: hypothetical protein VK578_24735 [Edaphobacter sp.]|nr:hypothetical protein [Edaphobacter sp.]